MPVEPGTVVLVGEVHGTWEFPAAVAAMAQGAGPVVVGLELARDDQPAVDRYLASAGGDAARAALLEARCWTTGSDGRSSLAVLGLVEKLRVRRQRGEDVDVALFDAARGSWGTAAERDRAMAEALQEAARERADVVVIALCGNLHAGAADGGGRLGHRPMGAWLREAGVPVVALLGAHAGGSAWCLTAAGAGPHRFTGRDRGTEPFAEISADGPGLLYVGAITASPPARGG